MWARNQLLNKQFNIFIFIFINILIVLSGQVVYITLERLWNLATEMLALVWPSSKIFMSKNLIMKWLQKIWSENAQKRRPRGSSIEHGEIWPAKLGQKRLPQIFQVHLLHLSGLETLFFPVYLNGMALK